MVKNPVPYKQASTQLPQPLKQCPLPQREKSRIPSKGDSMFLCAHGDLEEIMNIDQASTTATKQTTKATLKIAGMDN